MHSKPNASQRTHGSLVRAGIIATLTMILASGCESAHKPTATKPPPPANLDTQTAGGVTRAFLTLLCEHCTAMAVEDQERADRARDQIIWHVLDRNALAPDAPAQRGRPNPRWEPCRGSADLSRAGRRPSCTTPTVSPSTNSPSTRPVTTPGPPCVYRRMVPTTTPSFTLPVSAMRRTQWRVVALDFEPEAPVSTTTTQPAAPNP